MKIFFTKKILSIFLVSLLTIFAGSSFISSANADDLFAGGNIVTAVNNTQRNTDWTDPVNASPGEIIEYRIVAQNMQQGTVAHDVTFHVNFPTTPSDHPQVQGVVSANGSSVSDTATVNVSDGVQVLVIYESGHTRVFSPACPGDGCQGDDSFRDGGNINVGDLAFGESAQVLFKAGLTNPLPNPSPSPSPSPSVVPSPSPSVVPSPSPSMPPAASTPPAGGTTNNNCTGSNSCSGSANANATATVNNSAPAATTTVAGTSTSLPKTGLPLLVWTALAFTPLGAKLKKFGKGQMEVESASYLWEDRQFKSQA